MKRRLLVLSSTYPRWADDPEPGFVHELNKRLASTFEVHVVCPHAPGAARHELMDAVNIHRFRYAPEPLQTLVQHGGILGNLKHHPWKWMLLPGFLIGEAWQTARLLRTVRPDAIHAHWIIPQGLILAALRVLGCRMPPLLLTSHGGDLFSMRGFVLARVKRWVLRRANAVTVVSTAMVADAGRLGVPNSRVSVIPMGVDFAARFTPSQARCDSHEILFVGRLVEKKGVRHLIDAMPAILGAVPSARLSIVGHGPELSALQELAGAVGVATKVSFLGALPQSELPLWYRRAGVFVAPFVQARDGDREGLGLVTAEAIACGCPVVISALPAVMDLLDPVKDVTMLCEPGNVTMLAEKVIANLRSPEAAHQQAIRARTQLIERMSWPAVAASYEALIANLMDSRERQHPPADTVSKFGTSSDRAPCTTVSATVAPCALDRNSARFGHAVLDLQSRNAKARKIEALIGLIPADNPLRILEVGTGSGGIAHYFGTHPSLRCEVDAVDVTDTRQIHDGYRFTKVEGVDLPFPDDYFDAVISNHVIEHVGDRNAQRRHLAELCRVMNAEGLGYLAVPNRWQLVEPHYRLAFLSWLPESWRTPYLQLRNRGSHYDCRPLTVPQIEAMLHEAGFEFSQHHGRALRLTFELEHPQSWAYQAVFKQLPDSIYAMLRGAFPTLIYTVRPALAAATRSQPTQ